MPHGPTLPHYDLSISITWIRHYPNTTKSLHIVAMHCVVTAVVPRLLPTSKPKTIAGTENDSSGDEEDSFAFITIMHMYAHDTHTLQSWWLE